MRRRYGARFFGSARRFCRRFFAATPAGTQTPRRADFGSLRQSEGPTPREAINAERLRKAGFAMTTATTTPINEARPARDGRPPSELPLLVQLITDASATRSIRAILWAHAARIPRLAASSLEASRSFRAITFSMSCSATLMPRDRAEYHGRQCDLGQSAGSLSEKGRFLSFPVLGREFDLDSRPGPVFGGAPQRPALYVDFVSR